MSFGAAEEKAPVMDRLNRIGSADRLGPVRIFLSIHAAFVALYRAANRLDHAN